MITIAICDDEKTMIEILLHKISQYLKEKKLAFQITAFYSGEALLLSATSFDIIFLDIKMEGINGMDTAKKIREQQQHCQIVFVTALKEYVFDAFSVDAVNYLIKPIDEKLQETLEKIIKNMDASAFSFWQNGVFQKTPYADIRYCEVLNHTVTIHTVKENMIIQIPMQKLENSLSKDFFRCHRSYLIHLSFIRSYSNGVAIMDKGEEVPIAKNRRSQFMAALMKYL